MKLSIETKLATAIGTSFVALVLCAIAQTQNDLGTSGSNEYALTDNPALTNPSREEFESSPSRSTTRTDAGIPLSNNSDQAPASANAKEKKTSKSTKHRSENARVDHSHDD